MRDDLDNIRNLTEHKSLDTSNAHKKIIDTFFSCILLFLNF